MAMAIEIPTLIPFSGIDLNGYSSAYIEVAAEIGGEVEVEIEESIDETARQRDDKGERQLAVAINGRCK